MVPRKIKSARFDRDSAKRGDHEETSSAYNRFTIGPKRVNQSHVTGGRTSSVRRQYDTKIPKRYKRYSLRN